MSRTKALRKQIKSILEELAECYHIQATDEAEYPYLCFEERLIGSDNNKYSYILEINVWDSGSSTSRIDELMDNVENKLNFYKHIDSNLQLSIYNGSSRQPVEDSDKSIKRIREQFELQVYERSC